MKKYVLILVLVIAVVSIMAGCASRPDMSVVEEKAMSEESSDVRLDVENLQAKEEVGTADGIQMNTEVKLNRKIIKTGRLDIESKQFDQTVQDLIDEVGQIGGFIENCYIQGGEAGGYSNRLAELTVRVPNGQFDKFMNDTKRYGNVKSKAIEGQDVTDQYMDTEIRLQTLEIQAQRLTALLEQAGSLEDLFKIEQELARITYEIETLKGTLKKYDSLVDYSTIQISIYETTEYQEVEEVPVTFGEKIKVQFNKSVKAVGDVLKGLVLVVVTLVPFVIVIGVPVGCGIVGFFKLSKAKKSKKNDKEK